MHFLRCTFTHSGNVGSLPETLTSAKTVVACIIFDTSSAEEEVTVVDEFSDGGEDCEIKSVMTHSNLLRLRSTSIKFLLVKKFCNNENVP